MTARKRSGTPWNTSVPLAPPSHREEAAFRQDAGNGRDFPSPGEGVAKTMFLGQVSWLPDRPRPAPSRRRDRSRRTDLSPPVDLAVRVPGHSGGGRAGISPASLFTRRTHGRVAFAPRRSKIFRGLEDDGKEPRGTLPRDCPAQASRLRPAACRA